MSDREKILVEYALLLGLYGEEAPQTCAFVDQYANDPTKVAPLMEVNLLYRELKERGDNQ